MKKAISVKLSAISLAVCLSLFALHSSLFLPGCASTVTPHRVEAKQASFDQGQQNSGIINLTATGAIITGRAKDRYNALADVYGNQWMPAIKAGYGLTDLGDGTWLISKEALEKWLVMAEWHRMGRKAK